MINAHFCEASDGVPHTSAELKIPALFAVVSGTAGATIPVPVPVFVPVSNPDPHTFVGAAEYAGADHPVCDWVRHEFVVDACAIEPANGADDCGVPHNDDVLFIPEKELLADAGAACVAKDVCD